MLLRNDEKEKGKRIDIFQSPAELYASIGDGTDMGGDESSAISRLSQSSRVSQAATQSPPDPESYELDKVRLSTLLVELHRTAAERQDAVIDSYRDLLLSDNILFLLTNANKTTFDEKTRLLYKKLTEKSIFLTAELGALVKTESVRHLQTIQDVCEIAADLQHDDVKFLERMYYIKPRFDTALLGYLNFAMQEERTRVRNRGLDPLLAPSDWLQVLLIVKQGVMAEFEARYTNILEPLLLVVRFEDPELRSELLKRFVQVTPAMELPYMRALALNMISNVLGRQTLGEDVGGMDMGGMEGMGMGGMDKGDIGGDLARAGMPSGSMYKSSSRPFSSAEDLPPLPLLYSSMRELKAALDLHLSDEVIERRVGEFEEEAGRQGKTIVVRNRNPAVQAEIEAMQEIKRRADVSGRFGEGEGVMGGEMEGIGGMGA
ncbi:hypothetical protein B484DRAFT_126234 [Ochromonadaceae sp. CCMP2298]|nr:hypothetical protein B484DRAFT_126234 [Ochromonadaceae sp. CCMP2298]